MIPVITFLIGFYLGALVLSLLTIGHKRISGRSMSKPAQGGLFQGDFDFREEKEQMIR